VYNYFLTVHCDGCFSICIIIFVLVSFIIRIQECGRGELLWWNHDSFKVYNWYRGGENCLNADEKSCQLNDMSASFYVYSLCDYKYVLLFLVRYLDVHLVESEICCLVRILGKHFTNIQIVEQNLFIKEI
jgi:hypothetical protein